MTQLLHQSINQPSNQLRYITLYPEIMVSLTMLPSVDQGSLALHQPLRYNSV